MSPMPTLHQETRLSSSVLLPSQILQLHTAPDGAVSANGAGRKRAFDEISGLDEETYARKYLATEGSVFFRRKQRAPRSFLWRVVEDRKVLEIHSVDPVHDSRSANSEGVLTFRVHLPGGITKNGITFADPDEADALELFVLTTANDLYTITLKRDLLTRNTVPSEFDPTSCLKKHTSSSLAFHHPYKLVAASSLELLVSLHDGGILRLTRQPGESGAQWRETIYSEGNWGDTIRGLISLKRHQTIPYGDVELEPSAAAAMARSPDGKYIWTVSLDHQLRAWSTATGKPVAHMDMLNQRVEVDARKQQKYLMNAEQGTLMQIVSLPASTKKHAKQGHDAPYFLVLRSPKDNQFKFYHVSVTPATSEAAEGIGFEDMLPATTLIPPIDETMHTGMWHLEDFSVLPKTGWQDCQLWIRARNGKLYRTFTLTFSLWNKKGEMTDVEGPWQSGWTVVDPGMQTAEALALCTDYPADYENPILNSATAAVEKWLDFVFYPGRFSIPSVETALNLYRKGRGLSDGSGSKKLHPLETPLKERLTQAVTSKIVLKHLSSDQPDYDGYQRSIQAEWNTFYSLLRDLHARRHESIGLALDAEDALAWSTCTDYSAPIRTTSQFEKLDANEDLLEGDAVQLLDEDVSHKIFPSDDAVSYCQILAAAKTLSSCLPSDLKEGFISDLISGSLEHATGDKEQSEKRVQTLYESHHFSANVMDDDYQALETAAQSFGGLGDLSESAIVGLLEWMQLHDVDPTGGDAHRALNRYGDRLTVAIAQETLERNRAMLINLLALVVFMYGDLDRADLSTEFVSGIGSIYDALVVRLKHNEMLSWLARNVIEEPHPSHRDTKSSQTQGDNTRIVTLLERIFIGDWDPRSKPAETLPVLLTKWSKQWAYGVELWDAWDGVTGHIIAFLIKEQNYDLAMDFQKFLSQTEASSSWLRYLEGRLLLATGHYAQASLKFQAAAEGMGGATKIAGTDTAYLLSPEEQNYFGDGQSRFYQHASALFEKLKIFSYAADMAALALDHLENGNDAGASSLVEIDRRKAIMESPAHQRADHTLTEIDILKEYERRKEEIRIRLFTALVETGRFKEALDALTGIAERPIRNANLTTLIKACIAKDAVPTLLEMPFEAADLQQEADTVLLALAKKSIASGSGGVPYHQILYAYRTQHHDFRGAAEILYEHLHRLQYTQRKHGILDPEDETLIQAYVLLINTLACCGEDNAWLLADSLEEIDGAGGKRKLVTIEDVRKEYGAELDKRSDILQGRFPLVSNGEQMDLL